MIKVIKLKHIDPKEALHSIQQAGIFNYMINWGCDIDEKNRRLIFTLRHGGGTGGTFDEELERAARDLVQFIKSIDIPK